jgi:site-specific recombinase XerD
MVTFKTYMHDVSDFTAWFEQTMGNEFALGIVDPRDIADYHGLRLQQGSNLTTINCRLVSLCRYFLWAKEQGVTNDSPFEALEYE